MPATEPSPKKADKLLPARDTEYFAYTLDRSERLGMLSSEKANLKLNNVAFYDTLHSYCPSISYKFLEVFKRFFFLLLLPW